jgi:hypothetical protein
MSIADIRTGLATNVARISGLRVSKEIPDNPNPPVAVIMLSNVAYDGAFKRGLVTYNFVITIIVGRAAEREAQRKLDGYISTGSSSLKAAVEYDKTLNGSAFDVRVSEMSNVGTVSLGEVNYLAADFAVQVISN